MSAVSIVPPPSKELEAVIGSDLYNKICQIHSSSDSPKIKFQKVDEIMGSLSEDVLRNIPIPKHLNCLPEEAKKEVHSIITNKELNCCEKYEKIRKLIKSQSPEVQAKCAFPRPKGFEHIPEDVKAQLSMVFRDDELSFLDKLEKLHQIINSLPEEIKSKIGPSES